MGVERLVFYIQNSPEIIETIFDIMTAITIYA